MKVCSSIIALCMALQFGATTIHAFVVARKNNYNFAGVLLHAEERPYLGSFGGDVESNFEFVREKQAAAAAAAAAVGTTAFMPPPPEVEQPVVFEPPPPRQQPMAAIPPPTTTVHGGPGMWDPRITQIVQGDTLKTWSYASNFVDKVQVGLKTDGRPLDTDIELWQGPDNTPVKMRVYIEDGKLRPFKCVIDTPSNPNTVAIRNIGQSEFPLAACVCAAEVQPRPEGPLAENLAALTIQGGALKTYPFESNVESVQIYLKTDGRPLNARIELLQGPNNNKQVIELYTEDGIDRPFYTIIETPGSGNVVRIVNTAPVEFPLTSWVVPYLVDTNASSTDVVLGGDLDW
mmetsp:Transcript_2118/g.3377  ORF Transcript_2118/g.3377 Transcript_2118/m.3377 type:complete len:346 (+) Transcript_2118:137-1174(+)|eukprot:CAMPEP_0196811496 /NCGR_PEP_ID=MMETSP1362-20130617/17988_1 /TAXON_ID=163516 /ORGANISM="Leptocylindrus danicus, Strain CCMP1856" /LENGTH=345 /DNA_ID=CAMNT_0042186803 /DNA_START=124 /DNA_END=1161 /DNA_ORIENTATION=+